MRALVALALACAGCSGCSGFASGDDAGAPVVVDSGEVDASVAPDAGSADAAVRFDAGAPLDAGLSQDDAGLPQLTECNVPSIDRLTDWSAPEGVLETASGVRWTLLVPEGQRQAAKVHFLGNDWHGALAMLTNANFMTPRSEAIVDATNARELVLTYSATSNFWMQLRSYDSFGGPNLFATEIPSTGGQRATVHLSFDRSVTTWESLFQSPDLSYAQTLAQLRAVAFVDDSENDLTFYGLRIDGYVPRCP